MKQNTVFDVKKILPNLSRLFIFFALSSFFIAVADAMMTYFVPIIITNAGISNTEMGMLMASSSVFGAIFDFLLSKYLKSTNYKRMYAYTIMLAILFPIIMFSWAHFAIFLFGMFVWGLYYNFWNFGYYDFVAREEKAANHASSFGFLSMFNDVGYVVGPLICAQFVLTKGSIFPMLTPMVFVILALLFFIGVILLNQSRSKMQKEKNIVEPPEKERNVSFIKELNIWYRVGRHMWPVLTLGIILGITEAMFWTVTPLIQNMSSNFDNLGGIFLAASVAPSLFVNWSVGAFTSRIGKKNTAIITFLISNLILVAVGFVSNPLIVIVLVFVSSLFEGLAFPAIAGAIADYLKESKSYDNEIISVKDFCANIGFIVGPMLAGFMMDKVGSLMIFSYFAGAGIIVSVLLLLFTPKNIDFHDRSLK